MSSRLLLAPKYVCAVLLTALASPHVVEATDFSGAQTLQGGIGFTTVLAFGPEDPNPASTADGCIYAVNGGGGAVSRICFDANKSVTSNTVVVDINGGGGINNCLGITFDPNPPAGEFHMYLGYSDSNNAPYNGKIARAVSTNGGVTYTVDEDFVTGLGRSSFDHQTNGLDFGPDDCLYISQGNNSNHGYSPSFAESRFSGGILRVCFKDGNGDVAAGFDGNCGGQNTMEACDVEIYASGLRNCFDIEWHSNGRLYNTDNDANTGFHDSCGSPANDYGCTACDNNTGNPGDELNVIFADAYYGSPNPYISNPAGLQCNGNNGGDSCTTNGDCGTGGTCADLSALCPNPALCGNPVHCYYFNEVGGSTPQCIGGSNPGGACTDSTDCPGGACEDPDGLWVPPINSPGENFLLDGLIEYYPPYSETLGSFCSDWSGDLLVTGTGGSDLRRYNLSPDGLSATHQGQGNLSGTGGLDVVVGPDGTIYVATLNGGSVVYKTPITQTNSGNANFFIACAPGEMCFNNTCSGTGCTMDGDCNDNNPCTQDTCNTGTGVCQFDSAPLEGQPCDDGDPGTINDTCVSGSCVGQSDDPDNDGLSGSNDPCPSDPRNLCAGSVAVDGTTGNDIRINSGTGAGCGGAKTDCNGDVWQADFGFNTGNNSTCNLDGGSCPVNTTPIFGCDGGDDQTDDIFQCERWDAAATPELIYSFDVPDGNYVVNLLFMNSFSGTAGIGTRVFDINIEGALVYDDFDQVDAAGGSGIPVVRAAQATVSDGNGLQIELVHVTENPAIKGIEVLQQAGCVADIDCDDSNLCTNDTCNAGTCEYTNNSAPCDDGVACTIGDACAGGVCAGTPSNAACDDSIACTDDVCDAVLGCSNTSNCTGGATCNPGTGLCETPAVAIRINVNGPAHVGVDYPGTWAADPGSGGVCGPNAFSTGSAINSTVDDQLFQGEVWGNPVSCAVGSGLPAGDYQVNLLFAEIFFGPGCNGGVGTGQRIFDVQLEGVTVESSVDLFAEAGCAASTTDPSTMPVVKSYVATISDGTLNISLPATVDNGKISAIEVLSIASECTVNADCDDSIECTDDVCTAGSCSNDPSPLNTPCTSDGNPCTDNICDGAGSCTAFNNTDPCDDGVVCTQSDTCSAGSCSGVPNDTLCIDGLECTTDVCTPVGCTNDPVARGTSCTSDGNPCTDNECDGAGSCAAFNNAAACDDSVVCTESDQCAGGVCAGVPNHAACDDSIECTDDVCTTAGCTNDPSSAGTPCTDDGDPCTDNTCNGAGSCTASFNTAPCFDGVACTVNDTCSGGVCIGTPNAPFCADGNPCTDDICTAAGCSNPTVVDGTSCDDGDPGTPNDQCLSGTCVGGERVVVELVAVQAPTAGDTQPLLPTGQAQFTVGDTFQLEVWAQTFEPNGLSSVTLDIDYDAALIEALALVPSVLFSEFTTGSIDNGNGTIDDLGGTVDVQSVIPPCGDTVGLSPQWVRVASIDVQAVFGGAEVMQAADSGSPLLGIAICDRFGNLAAAEVQFGSSAFNTVCQGTDTTCDGIDDDCDGTADDDFPSMPTNCGVGACAAAGSTVCVAGAVQDTCVPGTPAPDDATCDGIDDDCDGLTDEDFASSPTGCGVGACAATGATACVAGTIQDSCMPGTPAPDDATCDGVDDDCDGLTDEDFASSPTNCGVGACAATGSTACVAGTVQDTCVPGTPAPDDATCDGVDDDCDALTDEDFVETPTTCGSGACTASGMLICDNGATVDTCMAGTGAPDDPTCDGVDDDCDGQFDEDYVSTPTSCGIGACTSTGSTTCVGGTVQDSCTPGTPAPDDATCDGIDDDCNGQADEDYVVTLTACGVGACASSGVLQCVAGVEQDTCTAGSPAADDATCDSVDDDCDGLTDEDFIVTPTACGIGACAATGVAQCVGGAVEDTCTPGIPAVDDPTCDDIDDDCDGLTDEDYVVSPTICGVGACASSGLLQCVAGAEEDSCVPGTPLAVDDVTCDGVDDDCDGVADEDYATTPTMCGDGSCVASGELICDDGTIVDTCTPGTGAADDPTCDGVDDDCDGQFDEDYVPVVVGCGIGACASTGQTACVGGAVTDDCVPGAPSSEVCDGIDNDCNGVPDDEPDASSSCSGGAFCDGQQACVAGTCEVVAGVCLDVCEACNPATQACEWCIFDHNFNGVVDGLDFAFFSGCFGACYPPKDICVAANYDGDGQDCVGTGDFSGLSGCFSLMCGECSQCFPSGGDPAPEAPGGDGPLVAVTVVPVAVLTPGAFANVLPRGSSTFAVGDLLFLELWARRLGPGDEGLAAVYVDLDYDDAYVRVDDVMAGDAFENFLHADINAPGVVRAFGAAAQVGDGTLGVSATWVRVGILTLVAREAGSTAVRLLPAEAPYGIALYSKLGDVESKRIEFEDVELRIERARHDLPTKSQGTR